MTIQIEVKYAVSKSNGKPLNTIHVLVHQDNQGSS